MKYQKLLTLLVVLAHVSLVAPARASEFSLSLDTNLFLTNPLGTSTGTSNSNSTSSNLSGGVGLRGGIHATLDLSLFSSQFDWRSGFGFQPYPASGANLIMYMGPQFRFSNQTNTPYLGAGLGLGVSSTLIKPDEPLTTVLSFFAPFKATAWAGYRFMTPDSNIKQSIEGYGTVGLDGPTFGLRWGIRF
jgi:hypothetical protein